MLFRRDFRCSVILSVFLLCGSYAGAADAPPTSESLPLDKMVVGKEYRITTAPGDTLSGKLLKIDSNSLQLSVRDVVTDVSVESVAEIRQRKSRVVANTLMGAAGGTLLGLVYSSRPESDNRYTLVGSSSLDGGRDKTVETLAFAGGGAVLGFLSGLSYPKWELVYGAAPGPVHTDIASVGIRVYLPVYRFSL